jgi:antitoxin component YwqK of YwqJK toxin-antitoxin module
MKTPILACLLLFTVLFGSTFVWSQTEKINFKDASGKRQGYWVYTGKDRPKSGYPATAKIEEGRYKDSRKIGIWIKYYSDGKTVKQKVTYVNNRPEGAYSKFHPNGVIKEVGVIAKNINKDSLKRYYENGTLAYAANYQLGKENGTVKHYYSNGQLQFEYHSAAGVPAGKATRYFENGDIKEILQYDGKGIVRKSEKREMVSPPVKSTETKEQKKQPPFSDSPNTRGIKFNPNGYNKVYNSNDDIWQDGNFKNGVLWEGKVYEYDSDGILLKVKVFKNGIYHSDGQL